MSFKQIESITVSNRARVFKSISVVFGSLPDHFKAGDLEKLAGFKPVHSHRMLVASVLTLDFKCRQVGPYGRTSWAKP